MTHLALVIICVIDKYELSKNAVQLHMYNKLIFWIIKIIANYLFLEM